MNIPSRIVRFSEQDLNLFSEASGDRNPLHLSASYASRTAYGQQVVFGALGCIACLGSVDTSSGSLERLVADFHRPIFLGIDYRLEATHSRDSTIARLFDGSIPVLTTTIKFSPSERHLNSLSGETFFPRRTARVSRWEELAIGLETEGLYRADSGAVEQLYERWSLDLDPMILEALLWSSYWIGMESPGESALFFRAAFDFRDIASSDGPFRFTTKIVNLNPSLAQVRTTFELASKVGAVVSGQLTCFVRPELPPLRFSGGDSTSAKPLAGKVAVVVGASRGLGAALAMTLAADGAHVVAVSRSEATWAATLPKSVADCLTFWRGDAGDSQALGELATIVENKLARLDFLICSAFPAIPSLRLEPNAAGRIQDYIGRATDLVLGPLCAFIAQLSASRGCTVLISSSAVCQPVRDWPHYVAAKSATEALCKIAPMQFPETGTLIVRPERLLTEMTNTPMGRRGAMSPLTLARQISQRLQHPPKSGTCEVLNDSGEPGEEQAFDRGPAKVEQSFAMRSLAQERKATL